MRPFHSLRAQVTLVVFLTAFIPNVAVSLTLGLFHLDGRLLAWLALVGLISGVSAYIVTGALLRPALRLRAEVDAGTFAASLPDDPSEVQALRSAFTRLVARVHAEQARRAAFMATLVHDLKTPLIATGHLAGVLASPDLPPAERTHLVREMQAETDRLLALVQQMSDAHRFEREDVHLNRAPTDLRALAERVATRARQSAPRLTVTVTGDAHAHIDARVLERAALNLTDNAVRYATRTVTLHVTPHHLCVTDDGPGLSAPLSTLAQPFNAQPTTIAGHQYTAGTAGLGLYIARRIAEAHGGTLAYTHDDTGTHFTLSWAEETA
ncbi:sensor histidine kinase [Deinococcus maricopensis]|uniref:histidine kinase n=1 Tax=Deinococcus maricopensis (strain DSM 21211 / LMG 22137 / NRRL B-23946 / LB-34) TaxID=709986 RepID=E8U5B9_DEIML|nr:HAMP domain-containing sensor histidine kinase [Deinococcus maricopensis]ADV66258.1 integral membrane sensor signal transduction histidine kinase [Deinococcus maricopensis DSM 21211]